MKEKMRNNRIDIYVSAILSLVMGILFIVFPVGSSAVLSIIIGVGILIIALSMLIGSIMAGIGNAIPGIIITLLLGVIGVWIIMNPAAFATIIPIAVGIMIVIHGISSFVSSFVVKGMGVKTWWLMLIGAIISIILGLICIFFAFGVLTLSMMVMGIMLIVDSIMTFVVTVRSNKYKRNMYGDKSVNSKVIK